MWCVERKHLTRWLTRTRARCQLRKWRCCHWCRRRPARSSAAVDARGEATEWGNGWEQIWKRLPNASVHVCDVKAPWVPRHDFLFFFFPFPLTSAEQMRHRQSRPSPETLPRTFATYQIEEAAGAAVQIKRCYSIKRSSYRKGNNLCKPRWMQFAHVAWKFPVLIRVWLRLSISWPPLWRWYLGWAITQHKTTATGGWDPKTGGAFLMETKLNWMNEFNHKRKVRISLIIWVQCFIWKEKKVLCCWGTNY